MLTRLTSRSAVLLGGLALFGALATASIRLDAASQQIAAGPSEADASFAAAGMDIPALTATAGKGTLPVLLVRDPI